MRAVVRDDRRRIEGCVGRSVAVEEPFDGLGLGPRIGAEVTGDVLERAEQVGMLPGEGPQRRCRPPTNLLCPSWQDCGLTPKLEIIYGTTSFVR